LEKRGVKSEIVEMEEFLKMNQQQINCPVVKKGG